MSGRKPRLVVPGQDASMPMDDSMDMTRHILGMSMVVKNHIFQSEIESIIYSYHIQLIPHVNAICNVISFDDPTKIEEQVEKKMFIIEKLPFISKLEKDNPDMHKVVKNFCHSFLHFNISYIMHYYIEDKVNDSNKETVLDYMNRSEKNYVHSNGEMIKFISNLLIEMDQNQQKKIVEVTENSPLSLKLLHNK
jgi:hypothetical protein